MPEELDVTKMHAMYCQKYTANLLSYETYGSIFVKEFNISFAHPRTDTCSSCDEFKVKTKALKAEISNFQQSKDSSAVLEKNQRNRDH